MVDNSNVAMHRYRSKPSQDNSDMKENTNHSDGMIVDEYLKFKPAAKKLTSNQSSS